MSQDSSKILFTSKPIFNIPTDLIEKDIKNNPEIIQRKLLEESKRIIFIDKSHSNKSQNNSSGTTNIGSNENLL